MVITRREKVALSRMSMETLAERITGVEKGELLENLPSRRSMSFKLDPELCEAIDSYAKKAKTSKTAVVEIFLWSAIEQMNALDGTNVEEFQKELSLNPELLQAVTEMKKAA